MKTKRKGIIITSAAILAVVIISLILSPFFRKGLENLECKKYLEQDLQNVDSIFLISHCIEIDGKKNSVAGVKEAIRLGADGVVVDMCFRQDGSPVMCSDYSEAESSPSLEDLFKTLNDEKYDKIFIYLNIIQLSDLSLLNKLAVDYNLIDRLFIIGIDEDRYGLINSDDTIIPFFLDYKVPATDKSAVKNGKFTVPECIAQYGATGLIISSSDINNDTISTYTDYGIPVIADNISSDVLFCKALINGSQFVYVDDIASTREILDKWIDIMLERNESSVELSLNNLSTTAD